MAGSFSEEKEKVYEVVSNLAVMLTSVRFYTPVSLGRKPLSYYPPVYPKVNREVNAVVSHINSPSDFYIQLVNMHTLSILSFSVSNVLWLVTHQSQRKEMWITGHFCYWFPSFFLFSSPHPPGWQHGVLVAVSQAPGMLQRNNCGRRRRPESLLSRDRAGLRRSLPGQAVAQSSSHRWVFTITYCNKNGNVTLIQPQGLLKSCLFVLWLNKGADTAVICHAFML